MRQTIQRIESQSDLITPTYLGGCNGFACHMVASVDLGNATHYDVNDSAPALLIYDEVIKGDAKNWYFVFPNILIRRGNNTFNGLAIQCQSGIAINWDGRLQRHGTCLTRMNVKNNHTIGWFWCGSNRTLVRSMSADDGSDTQELMI